MEEILNVAPHCEVWHQSIQQVTKWRSAMAEMIVYNIIQERMLLSAAKSKLGLALPYSTDYDVQTVLW